MATKLTHYLPELFPAPFRLFTTLPNNTYVDRPVSFIFPRILPLINPWTLPDCWIVCLWVQFIVALTRLRDTYKFSEMIKYNQKGFIWHNYLKWFKKKDYTTINSVWQLKISAVSKHRFTQRVVILEKKLTDFWNCRLQICGRKMTRS